jgi:hypothetical protein
MNQKRMHVILDKKIFEKLRTIAYNKRQSIASIIRKAIDFFLLKGGGD